MLVAFFMTASAAKLTRGSWRVKALVATPRRKLLRNQPEPIEAPRGPHPGRIIAHLLRLIVQLHDIDRHPRREITAGLKLCPTPSRSANECLKPIRTPATGGPLKPERRLHVQCETQARSQRRSAVVRRADQDCGDPA